MADIRINALATTATTSASDDYVAIDGSANGTRKLSAYSPTFGGNLTVSGGTVTSGTGALTLNSSGNSVLLQSAGTTALTLDSSQNATFAGKVTPTGGIVGTTTNNNAAAGNVGEYVEGVVLRASAVSLTTATVGNVSSITLGAGDWDVSGYVSFLAGGSTVRTLILSGLANGTSSLPDIENGSRVAQAGSVTGGTDIGMATAIVRYSLTGNTTIYLNAYSEFTTSTMQAYVVIRARRVR